ncbi:hypothetical protein ACRALDRAFT_2099059 [Sodiomyces alcalophilus JCM 7366]|uniref:uncharacterized protein n=1 Tax=Sodiomyces alcalophilus JCM 7366 TaxID=591952 RepID=UPI0039B527D5
MSGSDNLSPPERVGVADPGTRDLAEFSESDDHFSDAQSAPMSAPTSPTPKTRVEKVDNEPSYGEVPGTEAYRKREEDAVPDEIAVVGDRSPTSPAADEDQTPLGSQHIPKTVVEESTGVTGDHSEEYKENRKADADADLVLKSDGEAEGKSGPETSASPMPELTAATSSPTREEFEDPTPSIAIQDTQSTSLHEEGPVTEEDEEDEEDDFDDFEEGGDDADFDDFDEGFEQPTTEGPPTPIHPQGFAPTTLPFPVPYINDLDTDEIFTAVDPCLHSLFPPEELDIPVLPPLPKDNPHFLTNRSASLWNQLVAPPPLSPPDWIRSRIRRLFLVSLGVPVDLDEILPASKQKKLVLPSSVHRKTSTGSLRNSSDSRPVSRLRQSEANASSTSLDSHGNVKPSSKSRRKGPPPLPNLDLVAARQLATTTDEALNGMTDDELKNHVQKLEDTERIAKEVLEYWRNRTDEKVGDREAFEGVIENLVKHARKVRK